MARDQVRRQADGLDVAAVSEKVSEAAVRERETAERLRGNGSFYAFDMDRERLAVIWLVKHAEWRRVRDLMMATGWTVYEPELDTQGSVWAREREERSADAFTAQGALRERRGRKRMSCGRRSGCLQRPVGESGWWPAGLGCARLRCWHSLLSGSS